MTTVNHPYQALEGTPLWDCIDGEVCDLERNSDLALTTARAYVVGSLCARLVRDGLAAPGIGSTVAVQLTEDEALVRFEFLYRFRQDERLSIEHSAEERALGSLLGPLERRLVAPFNPQYAELLAAARDRLAADG